MHFTPEMDARIVELYSPPYIRGSISAQARAWKCATAHVSRRAQKLGLTPIIHKRSFSKWTIEEIILLRKSSHLTHKEASQALNDAGYQRTPYAIDKFRFRDGWRTHVERDESTVGYSAEGLADILCIHSRTVRRWIKSKLLKASQEGGNPKTRIDTYRIQPKQVKDFLKKYVHYVDLSKVDKYWLIDTLTL